MRDPQRIDKVLAKVREVWKTYPDLRLLQLLLNTLPKDSMAYYLEDDELLKRIDAQYYDQEKLYPSGGKT